MTTVRPALGTHVVQFYEHDAELVGAVGGYVASGLRSGEVVVVIATGAHRHAIEAEVERVGVDLTAARDHGAYWPLDAAATLALLMPAGRIDRNAFRTTVGGIVRTAAADGRHLRAFGEMVALLWDAGDVVGAIALERRWNELARELRFDLFCAYPAPSSDAARTAFDPVCALHSDVLTAQPRLEANDGAPQWQSEVVATFEPGHDAPRAARRFVADELRRLGHPASVIEGATVVSSELASNAVVHARSPFTVAVRCDAGRVRISVGDSGPPAPQPGQGLSIRRERGMGLVDAIAHRWGVEPSADGRVVWVEFDAAA